MAEIVPTDLSEAGLRRVAALLHEVFPKAPSMDLAYLRWGYASNPMGEAVAFDAHAGGSLVAHLAGRALVARLEGCEERGLLIHHAATRAAQRGQGLFGRLLEAIAEAGRAVGVHFLVAIANRQSAPIFVRRHAFQRVAPLGVALGIGLPPGWQGEAATQLEPVWSPPAIAWRLGRPGADYRVRRIDEAAQVVARTSPYGAWMELAWLPTSAVPAGLPTLGPALRLGAWIGMDPRRRARPWAAAPVPVRLRPSPLELVFRDLAGDRRLDRKRIAFRVLDFDAY